MGAKKMNDDSDYVTHTVDRLLATKFSLTDL